MEEFGSNYNFQNICYSSALLSVTARLCSTAHTVPKVHQYAKILAQARKIKIPFHFEVTLALAL